MDAKHKASRTSRPIQDQAILRGQAYADSTHLDVRRRTHQLYTVDPVDFGQWTLERIPWQGDERVLDVGCGPGELLCEMACHHEGWGRLVGFDFSPGMGAQAAAAAGGLPVRVFVGDAQAIPFADASFDVVMARHMLYHVPDIDRAVAEAARVLGSGGYLLTTTNSAHSMHEYRALRSRAAARFPVVTGPEWSVEPFCLENAPAFLAPYFESVTTTTLTGTLRFPVAQPLIDYFASSRSFSMHPDHTEADWQAVLGFVRTEVQAAIDERGHFDITKVTGAIVGRKEG
jgi:SAM-dependent methyltransferase